MAASPYRYAAFFLDPRLDANGRSRRYAAVFSGTTSADHLFPFPQKARRPIDVLPAVRQSILGIIKHGQSCDDVSSLLVDCRMCPTFDVNLAIGTEICYDGRPISASMHNFFAAFKPESGKVSLTLHS